MAGSTWLRMVEGTSGGIPKEIPATCRGDFGNFPGDFLRVGTPLPRKLEVRGLLSAGVPRKPASAGNMPFALGRGRAVRGTKGQPHWSALVQTAETYFFSPNAAYCSGV